MAAAKPATPAHLRSTYEGLTSTFDLIQKTGYAPVEVASDAVVTQDLKSLLFRPVVSIESLRAARADAVTSILKACPSLKAAFDSDVNALIANEVSSSVRDRLRTP